MTVFKNNGVWYNQSPMVVQSVIIALWLISAICVVTVSVVLLLRSRRRHQPKQRQSLTETASYDYEEPHSVPPQYNFTISSDGPGEPTNYRVTGAGGGLAGEDAVTLPQRRGIKLSRRKRLISRWSKQLASNIVRRFSSRRSYCENPKFAFSYPGSIESHGEDSISSIRAPGFTPAQNEAVVKSPSVFSEDLTYAQIEHINGRPYANIIESIDEGTTPEPPHFSGHRRPLREFLPPSEPCLPGVVSKAPKSEDASRPHYSNQQTLATSLRPALHHTAHSAKTPSVSAMDGENEPWATGADSCPRYSNDHLGFVLSIPPPNYPPPDIPGSHDNSTTTTKRDSNQTCAYYSNGPTPPPPPTTRPPSYHGFSDSGNSSHIPESSEDAMRIDSSNTSSSQESCCSQSSFCKGKGPLASCYLEPLQVSSLMPTARPGVAEQADPNSSIEADIVHMKGPCRYGREYSV